MRTVILAVLISAPLLTAQGQMATAHEGQRVRIASISGTAVGVVRRIGVDSVIVYTEPTGASLAVPAAEIRRLDVSLGRSAGTGAKRGAVWGGAIGAGIALLGAVAIASDKHNVNNNDAGGGNSVADFAANMIGGCMTWGAIIGAFVKAERWERVDLRPSLESSPPRLHH